MISTVIENYLVIIEDEITEEDDLASIMLQYSYNEDDDEEDTSGHT